jgi:hypothetical protein
MPRAFIRTVGFVAGVVLLTTVARAQTAPAPKPADAPNAAGTPKAADATKPAEASKSAAGAAVPVGTTKPGDAAKAVAPPAGGPTPAAIDWKSMDKKARKTYMKTKVMPEMKKAFQAYDAKRYKSFTCVTCHGDGAVKGDFKMPNAKLPRLPKDMAGFKALGEKKPEAMKFMGGEVKPKMAALLNMPEYKPEHPTGFGCNACHMSEGQ